MPVEELSDMPVELAQAVQSHGSVPGVDRLEASVAFDFLRSNGEYVRNDHFLRGLVAADGQFRLIDTRPVLREGDPVLLQETLVFDRRLFCSGKEGSRFYHAYPTGSDAFASAMATETQQIGPLLEWVRAPFLVSRVPGTCWEVHQEVAAVAGSPRIRVVETYGDVQSSYPLLGRTEYVLELAATWHPVAIESYSESGRLTESIELSDYREIQPGTWRPFAVTVREHTETATAPTFVSRLRIDRTTVLDEVPGRNEIALLESPTGRWIVHD